MFDTNRVISEREIKSMKYNKIILIYLIEVLRFIMNRKLRFFS